MLIASLLCRRVAMPGPTGPPKGPGVPSPGPFGVSGPPPFPTSDAKSEALCCGPVGLTPTKL
ncbi:hypothetical protein F3K34_44290 [Streptomyces sp. LBUM 1486]|nr:hypothetical protein [Streptomyces sp. LBUM 1486]